MVKAELKSKLERYICVVLVVLIAAGMILHVVPYFYNRSLWIDEAFLASSIFTRSFSELIASPLDWGQNASVGWLYIVKAMTGIFGSSEAALRVTSLLAAFGCIALIYLLAKDKVKKHFALFFTAVFAWTDKYIYFANEAKPYMLDNLTCLLALYVWQKYREKKLSLLKLVLIYSVLVWFSFSAVFLIAACMIIECVRFFAALIRNKDKRALKQLGLCAVVLVSFGLNYVLWLSRGVGNAGDTAYWDLLKFPLIPRSAADLKLIVRMAGHFLSYYSYAGIVFALLFLVYVADCIRKRRDTSSMAAPFVLSVFLLFVASYMGFYPIQNRLVQVNAIIMTVLCAYGAQLVVQMLETRKAAKFGRNGLCILLLLCFLLLAKDGIRNVSASHVYMSNSQVASNFEYLKNNMTEDDTLYLQYYAIPVYTYETGYETDYTELMQLPETEGREGRLVPTLPHQKGNTIFGQILHEYDFEVPYSYASKDDIEAIEEDAALILEHDSVYIFMSHNKLGMDELVKRLEQHGTVETVNMSYKIPLLHFERAE